MTRPGASLDAYRCALRLDLFAAHVAACRGGELPTPPETRIAAGSLIVHARRNVVVPGRFPWPAWTEDRTPSGTRIPAGGPICTVLAEDADRHAVERRLRARAESVLSAFADRASPSLQALCLEPA